MTTRQPNEERDVPDIPLVRHPTLEHFNRLVGTWEIEATHPLLPGVTISGQANFAWLEGRHFLIWRTQYEHPDIPDSIAMLGFDNAVDPSAVGTSPDPAAIHYFDSRGVYRVSRTEAGPGVWRIWRDWPGFSQRFTGTFSDDGDTIVGVGELSEDDATWKPDLQTAYRRVR